MPGALEKLLVTEGQVVAAGDVLCTVSAMKMEVSPAMLSAIDDGLTSIP